MVLAEEAGLGDLVLFELEDLADDFLDLLSALFGKGRHDEFNLSVIAAGRNPPVRRSYCVPALETIAVRECDVHALRQEGANTASSRRLLMSFVRESRSAFR
ncbi:hypothetical protein GCM10009680_76600 [Streptomyces yatensis]|uniref:Resolvase/invertase-type recombinase catalytic domain-containing protein n=1 Tax=Streptomyces yatensis TaxID=155177 RepID=A0ABN2JEK5_9ACTN